MSDLAEKNLRIHSGFTITPKGWAETTVSQICELGRGRVISQDEIKSKPGPFPVFSSQTRNNGEMGRIDTFDFSGEYVTWTTDGENAGTVFFRSGQFNCTNVCGTLRAKASADLDLNFLTYHLGRVAKRYVSYIGNPKLMNGVMASIGLVLPPGPQQRRIATILTTLDEVIEATEKLVEKHQQIKAGLMHDLFTRGLWTRPELARGDHHGLPCEATAQEGQLRPKPEEAPGLYQDSPLGLIPKAWSFASISDLGVVKGGKRLPAGTPFSETPTQFPYLRVTDMVDGWIDDSALEFVDPHIEPLIASYKIFKNDIYVTIAGTLGQFGRIPPHLDGAQLTENAARITEIDQKRVCLDFMCAFLRSNLMAPQKFKAYGLGAGVPKLALYQIERFILPLPPIEEQRIAETVLASARNDIQSNLTHLAKLRQQKQGLMHDLLTGRVRVA